MIVTTEVCPDCGRLIELERPIEVRDEDVFREPFIEPYPKPPELEQFGYDWVLVCAGALVCPGCYIIILAGRGEKAISTEGAGRIRLFHESITVNWLASLARIKNSY